MSTIEDFQNLLKSHIDTFKVELAGVGGNIFDFAKMFEQIKVIAIKEAGGLAAEGYQKKQAVLTSLQYFMDTVAIPMPWYWKWAMPILKSFLLKFADGSIEFIYNEFIKEVIPAVPPVTTG